MMVELPVLYGIFVSVAAALAIVAVWSRRRLVVRAGAVGILVLIAAISYAAFSDLLSRPKPAMLEFGYDDVEQATVLAAALREGSGIYLWPGLRSARDEGRTAFCLPVGNLPRRANGGAFFW